MNIFHELGVREGKDRINEEVIYNIASVYSLTNSFIGSFLSGYGLSPARFNILLMVKHVGKERGLPQNKISGLLLVTTSNMTKMIDKLENDRYVERISQNGDRRIKLIKITKKGSELLNSIWPHYRENIDLLMETILSKSEKSQMNRLLEKIKDRVKKVDKKKER